MSRSLTDAELVRLRFASHGLAAREQVCPEAVVARMGAIQSQDYASSLWALGVRQHHASRATVERALCTGSIVRTWPMRGTLHLVAAADVRWMLRLMASRQDAAARRRGELLGLDDSHLALATEVVTAELVGGRAASRSRLYAALEARGIPTIGSRGLHLLGCLARGGLLCLGPRQGAQPTYVLLEEWVPASDRDEWGEDRALAEIAWRYVSSHGPVTDRDLATWTGLPLRRAREGIAAVANRLRQVDVGGVAYWMSPEVEPQRTATVLLPGFDEYVVGYADRSRVVPPAYADRVVHSANGVFRPVVLSHGVAAGSWTPGSAPSAADLDARSYAGGPLPGLDSASRAYRQFLSGSG